MKDKKKIVAFGCFGLVISGCLAFFLFGLLVLDVEPPELPPEVATVDRPSISPSGKYELSVNRTENPPGVHWLHFQIRNLDDGAVFFPDERFAAGHTTFFLWDSNDRVWVYSGDIGTYFWTLDPLNVTWIKSSYDASDIPAPAFLKEVRPESHPR